MKKIILIIEKAEDGKYWGRVNFQNNLLVEFASSVDSLQHKMTRQLGKFHSLQPSAFKFELAYDLAALFAEKDYLNISAVAVRSGISPGLMRQYVAGFKYPSLERAGVIETTIREIGSELKGIRLTVVKQTVKAPNRSKKTIIRAKPTPAK